MATVDFVPLVIQADAFVYRATPMVTGDTTSVLTINEGAWDIGVHAYGTVAGSTISVTAGIASAVGDFAVIDDAYGAAMNFIILPQFKPVGPPVRQLRGIVTGGAGSGITFDVIVTRKKM